MRGLLPRSLAQAIERNEPISAKNDGRIGIVAEGHREVTEEQSMGERAVNVDVRRQKSGMTRYIGSPVK